ncbi:MAG: alanine--tRNA ligase [Eubacteriales bacterium]|nr:alanine--tRNA ligase [Eubacteriales bacterium]
MKQITAQGMRDMFLNFFKEKQHAIIPSSSVIPENDPTVLFTTAGMHPLVPYLMGQPHPAGKRLANVQKCIRTGDIDDVGDDSHLTFFEMLGNWSLGDYFKEAMIPWSWEFLTDEKYLGIPKDRLAVTVFEGDKDAPRDEESAKLWEDCGLDKSHIFYLDKKHNWWGPAGLTGPCGPDTEMFYITDKEPCGENCSPACSCGRYLEIWNDVFMQYNKLQDGNYEPLKQKNVDTGMGIERIVCTLTGQKSVYETEFFMPIINKIEELSGISYKGADEDTIKAFRIVADHIRTSTFILGDPRAVTPSNVDQGYVLRRLIRRAVRYGMMLNLEDGFTKELAKVIIENYSVAYPELKSNGAFVIEQFALEEERFQRTLKQGTKMFEKVLGNIGNNEKLVKNILLPAQEKKTDEQSLKLKVKEVSANIRPTPEMQPVKQAAEKYAQGEIELDQFIKELETALSSLKTVPGRDAFKLYDTYGFPIEMTVEMAKENGLFVDEEDFARRFEEHQKKSHAGAEQRFKGGLADHSEQTTRLHTATHLLQAALRKVLGDEVEQRGSNITAERLRFDFSFGRKMTPEEVAEVERLVNEAIAADAPVTCEEMTFDEAKAHGAIGLFEDKYGEKVKVYTVKGFSMEVCGGPHVTHTGEIGSFTIQKEGSSSAGVRRIRATIGA